METTATHCGRCGKSFESVIRPNRTLKIDELWFDVPAWWMLTECMCCGARITNDIVATERIHQENLALKMAMNIAGINDMSSVNTADYFYKQAREFRSKDFFNNALLIHIINDVSTIVSQKNVKVEAIGRWNGGNNVDTNRIYVTVSAGDDIKTANDRAIWCLNEFRRMYLVPGGHSFFILFKERTQLWTIVIDRPEV